MNMVKIIKRAAVVAFFSVSLSACVSTQGPAMQKAQIDSIKDGVTTLAQIEQMFGKTAEMSLDASGNKTYVYRYIQVSSDGLGVVPVVGSVLSKTTSNQDILQVVVDKSGIVRQHDFSNTSTEYSNSPLSAK